MEIYLTSFSEAVKDINLQKSEKTAFTNLTLFVFYYSFHTGFDVL